MAVLLQYSGVPYLDANGAPYSGAKAFFYDPNSTTPLTTYADSGLGTSNDNPVVANASGVFPPIFVGAAQYKLLITSADGSETIFSCPSIDTPEPANSVPPSAGDTDPTLLASTGDLKWRYDTAPLSGYVRANGKSIGSATSSATERANADTEALFTLLWGVDSTLAVSGGRGSNAAADFAANKNIALPDLRGRAIIGRGTMGNAAISFLTDAMIDNSKTADTLGATLGEAAHALTVDELAQHNHGGTTGLEGAHTHNLSLLATGGNSLAIGSVGAQFSGDTASNTGQHPTATTAAGTTHNHSILNAGSSTAHNNMQPSSLWTGYLKL